MKKFFLDIATIIFFIIVVVIFISHITICTLIVKHLLGIILEYNPNLKIINFFYSDNMLSFFILYGHIGVFKLLNKIDKDREYKYKYIEITKRNL